MDPSSSWSEKLPPKKTTKDQIFGCLSEGNHDHSLCPESKVPDALGQYLTSPSKSWREELKKVQSQGGSTLPPQHTATPLATKNTPFIDSFSKQMYILAILSDDEALFN